MNSFVSATFWAVYPTPHRDEAASRLAGREIQELPLELNTQIDARGASYPIAGEFATEFQPVVDAFVENFVLEDEVGAACSVMLDGRTVVDVWGGWRNSDMTVAWDEPTTVCMMSVAKGITAICFNMLIDGGFSRKACFWDFSRHLDRLDAILITRLSDENTSGMSALLNRKTMSTLYPQIGHVFSNFPSSKTGKKEDGKDDLDDVVLDKIIHQMFD